MPHVEISGSEFINAHLYDYCVDNKNDGSHVEQTVTPGLVEAIGGRVLLDETPGGGLTATIRLRRA